MFFFLLQPLSIGGYSNKGSKLSGGVGVGWEGGGEKGGTQAFVGGFQVGREQIGDRGAARTRVHSSHSPLLTQRSQCHREWT